MIVYCHSLSRVNSVDTNDILIKTIIIEFIWFLFWIFSQLLF